MAAQFQVSITTSDKTIFEGPSVSLIAPASTGYLGILAHHRPIMTLLSPGKIILKDEKGGQATFYSTGSGFLEFSKNIATLLLDSVRTSS